MSFLTLLPSPMRIFCAWRSPLHQYTLVPYSSLIYSVNVPLDLPVSEVFDSQLFSFLVQRFISTHELMNLNLTLVYLLQLLSWVHLHFRVLSFPIFFLQSLYSSTVPIFRSLSTFTVHSDSSRSCFAPLQNWVARGLFTIAYKTCHPAPATVEMYLPSFETSVTENHRPLRHFLHF